MTPVYEAALKGHHDVLQYLLDVKSSPDIVDMYCQSPLHVAVMSGHIKCVKLLVEGKYFYTSLLDIRYVQF